MRAGVVMEQGAESYPKPLRRFLLAGVAVALAAAGYTTPVTGRSSLNVFSPADDVQLGLQAYGQLLSGAELISPARTTTWSCARWSAWSRSPTIPATPGR